MAKPPVNHSLDPLPVVDARQLGLPTSITVDQNTEFMSKALEDLAWRHGVRLDFICPGKPNENAHIESSNGPLRDERLNVHRFVPMEEARRKIEAKRRDHNRARSHGSLRKLTASEFAYQGQQTRADEGGKFAVAQLRMSHEVMPNAVSSEHWPLSAE
jgi:transposase InsO family protein